MMLAKILSGCARLHKCARDNLLGAIFLEGADSATPETPAYTHDAAADGPSQPQSADYMQALIQMLMWPNASGCEAVYL